MPRGLRKLGITSLRRGVANSLEGSSFGGRLAARIRPSNRASSGSVTTDSNLDGNGARASSLSSVQVVMSTATTAQVMQESRRGSEDSQMPAPAPAPVPTPAPTPAPAPAPQATNNDPAPLVSGGNGEGSQGDNTPLPISETETALPQNQVSLGDAETNNGSGSRHVRFAIPTALPESDSESQESDLRQRVNSRVFMRQIREGFRNFFRRNSHSDTSSDSSSDDSSDDVFQPTFSRSRDHRHGMGHNMGVLPQDIHDLMHDLMHDMGVHRQAVIALTEYVIGMQASLNNLEATFAPNPQAPQGGINVAGNMFTFNIHPNPNIGDASGGIADLVRSTLAQALATNIPPTNVPQGDNGQNQTAS